MGSISRAHSTRVAGAEFEEDKRITLRIPEASHGPAGITDHHHDVSVKAVYVPKELYEHIVEAGVTKSKWRLDKQIVMGLLAGFYIGFSFTYMMVIGGQIPGIQHGENPGVFNLLLGSFGFPLGLFMICVVGADLFTSNCAYMVTALHEGKITIFALIKCLVLSWFVNCAGCIIMAEIVNAAAIFDGRSDFIIYLANKKTHSTFSQTLCKGILANWLVNLAVWIANSAQDVTGKAVGIYLPISAFISIGGEHCIANQFLFALAKLYNWDMSVNEMIVKNLIPATIGNIIGGAFFVGSLYSFALGGLFDSTYEHAQTTWRAVRGKSPLTPEQRQRRESEGQSNYANGVDKDGGRSGRPKWTKLAMNALVMPHWLHLNADQHGGPVPGIITLSDKQTVLMEDGAGYNHVMAGHTHVVSGHNHAVRSKGGNGLSAPLATSAGNNAGLGAVHAATAGRVSDGNVGSGVEHASADAHKGITQRQMPEHKPPSGHNHPYPSVGLAMHGSPGVAAGNAGAGAAMELAGVQFKSHDELFPHTAQLAKNLTANGRAGAGGAAGSSPFAGTQGQKQ